MPEPHDTGQPYPIKLLRGQASRPPVTALEAGRASQVEGTYHDSDALRLAPGTRKLIQSPIPGHCYELNGQDTGILWIPTRPDLEWNNSDGATGLQVALTWGIRFLNIGGLKQATASSNGQKVFVSRNARNPSIGEVEAVHLQLELMANAAGKLVPGFRVLWGTTVNITGVPDDLIQTDGSVSEFDWDGWWWLRLYVRRYAAPTDETHIEFLGRQLTQEHIDGGATYPPWFSMKQELAGNKAWYFDHLHLGGSVPSAQAHYAIADSCHCLLTEVWLQRGSGWVWPFNISPISTQWTRQTSVDSDEELWPMNDAGTSVLTGLNGGKAYLVGNQVHRDQDTWVGRSQRSIRFNGDSMIWLRDAAFLRETPKSPDQGGVPLHYLERPELSIGFWVKHDKDGFVIPFLEGDTSPRACIACWTTPYTYNFGVPDEPTPVKKPGEHLRCEIVKHTDGYWYLYIYFGELDPNSLQHPIGVPGGSTSETWPPGWSRDGYPPPTYNLPITLPGTTSGAALKIKLGADADDPHPTDYSWFVIMERKFVAQGDSGNTIAAYAYRYSPTTHAFDDTAGPGSDGEFYDETGGLSPVGTKHPDNQSCYTSLRIGVVQMHPRTDVYAFSLGAACPGKSGDELGEAQNWGWNTSGNYGITPATGEGPGFVASDLLEGFAFRGNLANFFAMDKFLERDDRLRLAKAGTLDIVTKDHFARNLIYHLPFDESAGNILREFRGRDISYEGVEHRVFTADTDPDIWREMPDFLGMFPRAKPTWHNEVPQFVQETSKLTGIVQRLDEAGAEEIYVTAISGLYSLDRATHALSRLASLPGQGGPRRVSFAIDHDDVIHMAGGRGRPVILTRNKVLAISGIDSPQYSAPLGLITAPTLIAGGFGIGFQSKGDTNLDNLVLYNVDDGAEMNFAIGYWSDILKTRSAPGPTVAVRYSDPQAAQQYSGTQPYYKYRVRLYGTLPLPFGFNASLITHWEVWRSTSNGAVMQLEWRIPISRDPPDIYVGWKRDSELGEEANHFRHPAPEGMRYIAMLGDRMFGVGTETEPRVIAHTVLGDATNWPPIYMKTLTATQQAATGVAVRRDRAFAFSRDYMYELADTYRDTDPDGRIPRPVQLTPIANKVGTLNQDAIVEDGEHGLFIPGNQTVFVTEGGVHRRVSKAVDSNGAAGSGWTWPDDWDLVDPHDFVSFHDERMDVVGVCGPATDDPNRIDALLLFKEHVQFTSDGRPFMVPECSRMKGVGITCVREIIDPLTGHREVWVGDKTGYLLRLGVGRSLGADYEWLASITPKFGLVMSSLSTTQLRLEGSYGSAPADLFRGAMLRLQRDGSDVGLPLRIVQVSLSDSWIDVTTESAHGALPGDHWTVGAIPFEWISGQDDMGSVLQEKRVHSVDIRFA